jgi:dual specificity tyrosine-phosphorylation-regulated kinase 2/3/4
MGIKDSKLLNYGFDTDTQEYIVLMNEHLAYRYEVVKKLGKGSFGIVLRCFDHKTKEFVALKILKNKKRLYKQGLVEAKLIENLNKHDPDDKKNIIRKWDHFVFRKHLIITFELLSVNLYEFIKMNNFHGFSLSLIKRFAIQILIALFYLKEHNIVHCDLKPENILLRKINKSGIKIIDFGSGCFENEKIYTYIQSRFYRAPEIMLSSHEVNISKSLNLTIISIQKLLMSGLLAVLLLKLSHQKFCFPDNTTSSK